MSTWRDQDFGLQILILIIACLFCYFYGRSTGFDDGEEFVKSCDPSLASSISRAKEELEKAKTTYREFYKISLKEELGEAYSRGWDDCKIHYDLKVKPIFKDFYIKEKDEKYE